MTNIIYIDNLCVNPYHHALPHNHVHDLVYDVYCCCAEVSDGLGDLSCREDAHPKGQTKHADTLKNRPKLWHYSLSEKVIIFHQLGNENNYDNSNNSNKI